MTTTPAAEVSWKITDDRLGEPPTASCTTHTTPGSLRDRIEVRHGRSCPDGYARQITVTYAPGTLDAVLDDAFGPADAGTLLAAVVAERFGSVTA